MVAKRVEYLKKIVPNVSRVALLVNPNEKESIRLNIAERREPPLTNSKWSYRAGRDKDHPANIAPAFSKMHSEQIDGVVVTQDGLFYCET